MKEKSVQRYLQRHTFDLLTAEGSLKVVPLYCAEEAVKKALSVTQQQTKES